MPSILDLEMAKTAYKIINDLCNVKPGESVLITTDSAAEWKPAEEIAKAAEVAGANVMVAWHSTPAGFGKVADPRLPDGLKAAIPNTDVWIELNDQWLLYSSPWEEAMKGTRVRYLFLGGLDTERFVRCIGKVDIAAQDKFQTELVSMTQNARNMRITNPSGTDVRFENDPERPVTNGLFAHEPGAHFLLGQIGWAPIEDTINGLIVFDGSFSGGGEAEIGILKEPVRLTVKKGVVVDIDGGAEAARIRDWLERLGDPKMYHLAHISYGYNPGAQLTGLCTEDERVWGSAEWGIGFQGPFFKGRVGSAVTHADGICLNSSVWLDGKLIVDKGKVVDEKLAVLAAALGK